MYKEIKLPELVAVLICDNVEEVRVNKVKLTEVRAAIKKRDKFMNVDFSASQYKRVAYLGGGSVRIESTDVIIGKSIPDDVRKRFQICYNSMDSDSKRVLESSIKKVLK